VEQKRDLAIVLRSIPYEERNRIVTALTEQHGLVTALARNSIQSRRFGGALELFTASEWSFVEKPGAELLRLDEASVRRSYEGLRADFERLSVASAMSEIMLRVAQKNESCPDLFKMHANALAFLEESVNENHLVLLNAYLAKILQWSGSQPQLDSCKGCHRPIAQVADEESLYCAIADAGWVCENCRRSGSAHVREQGFRNSSLRVTPLAIADFLTCLSHPIRQIPAMARASKKEHEELFRFLEGLALFHIPGLDQNPIKSFRFLGLESKSRGRSD
jgi:DNA repair protein RecO (recombination protein O)